MDTTPLELEPPVYVCEGNDPGASEAIRFAGCSTEKELIDMGVKT